MKGATQEHNRCKAAGPVGVEARKDYKGSALVLPERSDDILYVM